MYCKDRSDGYGGVLLAMQSNLVSEQVYTKDNTESVFASFKATDNKTVIVGSLYRPPSDQQYIESICECITSVQQKFKAAIMWLGGDLNLPDICWESTSIKGHQNPHAVNSSFIDMVQTCGMDQVVDFPTRNNNTLDLFLTNRPSLINKCEPLPAISDHDIVFIDTDIVAKRQKPVKRKIYLWKNANMDNLKADTTSFSSDFILNHTVNSPVDSLWEKFKSTMTSLMRKHIPSKLTSTRFHQPWITSSVKRLSNQKKRSFIKAKKTQKKKDYDRYLKIKRTSQTACRQAYREYLTNIVSPDSKDNPKRFWSFIKSKRCDNSGVAPLKGPSGITYSDNKSKAQILNDQFCSVFNKNEDPAGIKTKGPSPFPDMPEINITNAGVEKLLSSMNIHKAMYRP